MFCEGKALILYLFPTVCGRTVRGTRAGAPTKHTGVEPLFIRCIQMYLRCAIQERMYSRHLGSHVCLPRIFFFFLQVRP